jgi:hypothetical protein
MVFNRGVGVVCLFGIGFDFSKVSSMPFNYSKEAYRYLPDDDLSSVRMGTKVLTVAPSSTLQIVHMADILTKYIIHHCAVDDLTYAIDLFRRLSVARD